MVQKGYTIQVEVFQAPNYLSFYAKYSIALGEKIVSSGFGANSPTMEDAQREAYVAAQRWINERG
jgi:hypothetical protein